MRFWTVTLTIGLLSTGCAPSPYQNIPPECQSNTGLQMVTGGKLGGANEAACQAAIMRQGGPMSIMKSPEQIQQELGGRQSPPGQQDMPPMTPEQMQQTQQLMQQMQPMMQQMQPMTRQVQPMQPLMTQPVTTPQGQTPTGQPGMVPPSMPQMTPEQQELMRQQMLQQTPSPTP